MDAWQAVLIAFGGQVALLGLLGWLAKSFGSQLLAKDLKAFESRLAAASNETTERLKHELQLISLEHEVQFSRLQERRATVIAALHSRLLEFQWAAESLVSVVQLRDGPTQQEKYAVAMAKSARFFQAFSKNRIFLPDAVCDQIEDFLKGMRSRAITIGVYADVNQFAPGHVHREKIEKWIAASEYFDSEVPKARKAIENEFRKLLGDKVRAPETAPTSP